MKKTGLIALALILALGSLGVGFAAWTQSLVINGTVGTGTYDVQFTSANVTEDVNGVATGGGPIQVEPYFFSFSIGNTYPGYVATVTFDISNTGTIPALISAVDVSNTNLDFTVDYAGITPGTTTIGVSETVTGTLTITIVEDASEGASGETFTVTIDTIQAVGTTTTYTP